MITVAIGATIVATSVPMAARAVESMRLSSGTREIERELQTARLKAVSMNRTLEVRFNCPATGQYRIVQITGVTATDTAANRCDDKAFPYPSTKDNDPATPSYDGPVRRMHSTITVSGSNLAFTPNGTALVMVSGKPAPMSSNTSINLTRQGSTSKVTVNALGKIKIG
jgi:Tfp pilus assembly protein FimT